METTLHSLSKLFTERLFRIPDYQRGYAWEEKQLKEFWDDLNQLEVGKNHYTGVITFEPVSKEIFKNWEDDAWIIEAKKYEPYFIVDGQQRLTTAIILIQAITEAAEKLEITELNYTTLEEIKKKFIRELKSTSQIPSFLFGYEKDNPSYEFLKRKVFLDNSDPSISLHDTIYTQNLIGAKQFFQLRLESMTKEDMEFVYKKATQHLLFAIYYIMDDIDVFVSFETMNNRGKRLSHLELLKNRLIYLTTRLDNQSYEINDLRKKINDSWKTIYHFLGKRKEKLFEDDIVLENHFESYFSEPLDKKALNFYDDIGLFYFSNDFSPKKSNDYILNEIFNQKRILKNTDNPLTYGEIQQYVNSLANYFELWYNILNPKQSDFGANEKIYIEKVLKITQRKNQWVVFFIAAFYLIETKNSVRTKFLEVFEKFLFISTLSARSHFRLDRVLRACL